MSLVLITAMQNFIIFMSDGRVTRQKTIMENEILREDYKKLRKVNANICIGFAGSKEPCEEVLKSLDSINSENTTIDNVCQIVLNEAKSVYSKYVLLGIPIEILMAVGGNQYGQIKFRVFHSTDGFKVQEYIPQGTHLNFAILSPGWVDKSNLLDRINANPPVTIDNTEKAMGECIDKVSLLDPSVNTVKFTEIIRS